MMMQLLMMQRMMKQQMTRLMMPQYVASLPGLMRVMSSAAAKMTVEAAAPGRTVRIGSLAISFWLGRGKGGRHGSTVLQHTFCI